MGPDVTIYSYSHKYKDCNIQVIKQDGKKRKKVIVSDDIWFGTKSIECRE